MCLRPAQGHNMISSSGEKSGTKGELRPRLPFTPEFPFFSVSLTSVSVCLAGLSPTLSLKKWRHHWAKTKRLWCDAEGGHADMFFLCDPWQTPHYVTFHSNPHMHAPLSGTHSGDLWEISDDISLSEISQPCSDPVVVAGVCITSKYFFCGIQQGEHIRWMKIGLMCLQKISKQH